MRDVVTELLDEKINENLKKIKEKIPSGIEIIIDCRWSSRGFFAEEATVTVWESQTNTIIGRYHIPRKKEKDSENRTYEGSSKAMEGYGVNKVMQNLQKEGCCITMQQTLFQFYFPATVNNCLPLSNNNNTNNNNSSNNNNKEN